MVVTTGNPPGIKCTEAKDAAQHPQISQGSPTVENGPDPNADSAKTKKAQVK